jgi:hypothetical protein
VFFKINSYLNLRLRILSTYFPLIITFTSPNTRI